MSLKEMARKAGLKYYNKNKEKIKPKMLQRHRERVKTSKYQSLPERLKRKYASLKLSAKTRDHKFNLEREEFMQWLAVEIEKPCIYCNKKMIISAGRFHKDGFSIDRKDNNKGYIWKNIHVCCMECNKIKNNCFTHEEMIEVGYILMRRNQQE